MKKKSFRREGFKWPTFIIIHKWVQNSLAYNLNISHYPYILSKLQNNKNLNLNIIYIEAWTENEDEEGGGKGTSPILVYSLKYSMFVIVWLIPNSQYTN